MEMPSFLQSKQVVMPVSGGDLSDRKKKLTFITLLVLVFAIPLTVWLAQRSQIFSPKADVVPIALVAGSDSCVVSTDPNKVSCASFPIKLTSPLGPPTQVLSCTSDSQCQAGNKCFNYQSYPGSCKPVDTVCAAVITRACHERSTCNEEGTACTEIGPECVDFPTPCHVPPGWVIDNGNRISPSPSPVPSSSSGSCITDGQCTSGMTCQFLNTPNTCPENEQACQDYLSSLPKICKAAASPRASSLFDASTSPSPSSSPFLTTTAPVAGGPNIDTTKTTTYNIPRIHIEWSPAAGATLYKVFRTTEAAGSGVKVGETTGLGLNDEDVVVGSRYNYVVEAVRASDSINGNAVSVVAVASNLCAAFNGTVTAQVVNGPNIDTAKTGSYNIARNHIEWSPVTDASVYKVFRTTEQAGSGVKVGETSGIAVNDQSALHGIRYNYVVEAVRASGSINGNIVTMTTVATPVCSGASLPSSVSLSDSSNVSLYSSPSSVTSLNTMQRLAKGFNPGLIRKAEAQSLSIDNGLVSHWKFDETVGNIAVDSQGVSNGTVSNAAIVEGKVNKARQIASANSAVVAADNAAYVSDYFTVAGWVKPESFGVGNFVSIFSRRNANNNQGLTLEYAGYEDAGNGQLQCVVFLNGGPHDEIRVANTNSFKLNVSQWSHVACTYDGSNVKVYINGVLAGMAARQGTMKNGAGMEIKMGQNPFHPANSLNGTLDEVMYWNRALIDSEIQSLAGVVSSPSPTVVASASLSPTPAASNLPGTSFYKVAETEAGLVSAALRPYLENNTIDFSFSNGTPGVKQIWAEFIGADNSVRREHISVEIVEPEPQITSFDCSMDISKQNLKLTFNGARLGAGSGKITLNDKDAQILTWGANQVTATIKPEGNLEDGKLFRSVLTKSDGKVLPEVTCQVGTTLISLGARLFCREPGKFDVNNVKVTLVDEAGNKVNEEVSIDTSGLIKGLKTKLQVGKMYAISVKAPFSVRRNAQFTAASGTNIISPADGEVFILPVGDIAPVILPDGKINTPDRSEIVRQWSVLGSGTKTADFNRDTRVNSIDWACMRYDFNAEDQLIPDRATPTLPSPIPSSIPLGSVSISSSPAASTTGSPSPAASGQRSAYFLLEPVNGGTYVNDDEFVVNLNVWSQNEAANLFAARLAFDPTALEVSRIERGTALTSWAEENFNNTAGTIALTAGLPNPGLKTTEGNDPVMAKIIFKSKKAGNTTITIANTSRIYSNSDNLNILTSLLSTQVAITN